MAKLNYKRRASINRYKSEADYVREQDRFAREQERMSAAHKQKNKDFNLRDLAENNEDSYLLTEEEKDALVQKILDLKMEEMNTFKLVGALFEDFLKNVNPSHSGFNNIGKLEEVLEKLRDGIIKDNEPLSEAVHSIVLTIFGLGLHNEKEYRQAINSNLFIANIYKQAEEILEELENKSEMLNGTEYLYSPLLRYSRIHDFAEILLLEKIKSEYGLEGKDTGHILMGAEYYKVVANKVNKVIAA